MQLIKAVFESLCRSLIRFFDNRFIRNTDVEYYRMELDKQRLETQRIIDHLLTPKIVVQERDEELVDYKPVSKNKSWDVKRRELEQASMQKAIQLRNEARMKIEAVKTTEQLEAELLNGTD